MVVQQIATSRLAFVVLTHRYYDSVLQFSKDRTRNANQLNKHSKKGPHADSPTHSPHWPPPSPSGWLFYCQLLPRASTRYPLLSAITKVMNEMIGERLACTGRLPPSPLPAAATRQPLSLEYLRQSGTTAASAVQLSA